jgi:hypothetical protein
MAERVLDYEKGPVSYQRKEKMLTEQLGGVLNGLRVMSRFQDFSVAEFALVAAVGDVCLSGCPYEVDYHVPGTPLALS